MDSDSVNEILERADKRLKLLDELNASEIDSEEPIKPSITIATTEKKDIPFIDQTTDSINDVDNKENTSNLKLPTSTDLPPSPRKSRFAKLSEDLETFEVDIRPKPSKESYTHGPSKRVSIGPPEKSVQEFFAPKLGSSPVHSSFGYQGKDSNTQNQNNATTSTPKNDKIVNNEELPYSPVNYKTEEIENSSTFTTTDEGETIITKTTTTYTTTYNYEERKGSVSSAISTDTDKQSEYSSTYEKPTQQNKVKALKNMFDTSNESTKSVSNFHKARDLFEGSSSSVNKYQSPLTLKHKQGITNVKKYDKFTIPSVPYSKKPASCEIVTGPTFKDSVNYWKDMERQNPYPSDDIITTAIGIFKPNKREAVRTNTFFKNDDDERNKDVISPSPKQLRFSEDEEVEEDPEIAAINTSLQKIQEESEPSFHEDNSVFEEETTENKTNEGTGFNDTSCLDSWKNKYKIKSNVLTESFDERSRSTSTEGSRINESTSVVSSSFVYKKPEEVVSEPATEFKKSLLDDINEEVTQYTTPKKDYSKIQLNKEAKLVHSLSNYRKNETEKTPLSNTNTYTSASTTDVVYALNSSKNYETLNNKVIINNEELENKLKSLDEKVKVYHSQINQMQAALNQARSDTKNSDITTEIDILKKITVAQIRRNACYLENARLGELKEPHFIIPRATIRFNKITVNLNRHLAPADYHYVFLFVAIRHEENIYVTETKCINDLLHRGIGLVEFHDGITVPNVSPDFIFAVEVYGISLLYKNAKHDKKTLWMKILHSPAPDRVHVRQGPDQFNRIGTTTLNATELRKTVEHALRDVDYPVENKIILKHSCHVTDADPSQWNGFISIYRVVENRGAWEHSYGRILKGRFSFWKYPEDADIKATILGFDIRDMVCPAQATTSERVGFQYDFVLKVLDSNDQIVNILLSTSEESERDRVLHILNQSYKFINTWSHF